MGTWACKLQKKKKESLYLSLIIDLSDEQAEI